MKIYIRYIFATLALFISAVSYSQKVEETRHVERDSVKIDVKYKTRYTAPFWSNLFLQGNFAGRVIYGEEDNGLAVLQAPEARVYYWYRKADTS